MIRYIKGDLFTTDAEIIAHGVNCRGGFGSGVAGLVEQKYPHVREAYRRKFDEQGWYLGEVQIVECNNNRVIANCATQDQYLPRGIPHADYNAIRKCMKELKYLARSFNFRVAIPKIGAGLAGGDWNTIEKIINEIFDDMEILVYTLD